MRSILTALQEGRLFELPEAGKDRALEFLARILDANPDIEVGTDAIEAIQHREQECNTGLGMGVAVPHVRAKRDEGELFCAIGWSQQGIEYGAPDGERVHLVFMYYIPGAQKNVYLKEVSILVKAIKKSGGIEPITNADNLNVVRNLLLDWVSEGLGDTGPEAVARMIKLEVKQAQALPRGIVASWETAESRAAIPRGEPAPAPVAPLETISATARAVAKVLTFSVLVAPPNGPFVLAQEAEWVTTLEKDNGLAQRLSNGAPFITAGRQVFITGITAYPAGRVIYQCVALAGTNG